MTTIVNTPAATTDSSGSFGLIIGLLVIAVALFVFFIYGLPAIRSIGSAQINIPGKIDVTINQPK